MAGEKKIILNPKITLDPSGANKNISAYVTSIELSIKRNAVDTSGIDDKRDRKGKSVGGSEMKLNLRFPATIADATAALMDAFYSDAVTAFEVFETNAAAGATNLKFTFNALVVDLPFNMKRGEVVEGSVTYPIDGEVTVTDGTTTWTL